MLRIVRSQPRTASLLSGNSALRAVFGSGRPAPQRQFSVFGVICNTLVCNLPQRENQRRELSLPPVRTASTGGQSLRRSMNSRKQAEATAAGAMNM